MSDSNPHHLSSVSDMKQHLQSLLDSKEKQLEQAATLGQQVLAQRLELEQRIGQLEAAMNEKADEDDIDSEARRRYRDLTDTLGGWDSENAQTSATFGPSSVSSFPILSAEYCFASPSWQIMSLPEPLLPSATPMALLLLPLLQSACQIYLETTRIARNPFQQLLRAGAPKMPLIGLMTLASRLAQTASLHVSDLHFRICV